MIYLGYFFAAVILIAFAVKSAGYVDLLDKHTKLSGAFLGGILLSAVTSMPELFTSLFSIAYGRPALCLGDVFGSNLFNLAVLAVVILVFFKGFCRGKVAKSYRNVLLLVFIIYILITLDFSGQIEGGIFHLSITSLLIVLIYCFGAKYLAIADDVKTDEDLLTYHASSATELQVKQLKVRFALCAAGVIVFSLFVTKFTVDILQGNSLEDGLAGAVFLGISTSLPELIFVITLFKMKNYNIGVGNIIGSNLFNLLILALGDMLYLRAGVYGAMDRESLELLLIGLAATVFQWIMLKYKKKEIVAVASVLIIGCYLLFLFI